MTQKENDATAEAGNGIGSVAEITPIMQKFSSYQSLMYQWERHPDTADNMATADECDRLFTDRINQISREILAMPSTCAADFAAKLIVNTSHGELFPDWNDNNSIWAEARAQTSQIAA